MKLKDIHGCVLTPIIMVAGIAIGGSFPTDASYVMLAAVTATLFFTGLIAYLWSKEQVGDEIKQINERIKARNALTESHNRQIASMVMGFTREKREVARNKPNATNEWLDKRGETLRLEYVERYNQQRKQYDDRMMQLPPPASSDNAKMKRVTRLWQWLVPLGFYLLLFSCSFNAGTNDDELTGEVTALMGEEQGDKLWNAANIVLPHISDGYRYVSNPDSIISAADEDALNMKMQHLEDSLDVQAAIIIVNRVEGGDVYQFAQDVFDRYGIGKKDRGLVLVVAMKDHTLRTHTGLALEADLTDEECYLLQEKYLIPSIKAGQPGTGLNYWATGLESLLRHKQMPQMRLMLTDDTDTQDDDGDGGYTLMLLMFLATLAGWGGFSMKARNRFSVKALTPLQTLRDNPFNDWLTGKINRETEQKDNFRDNHDRHYSSHSRRNRSSDGGNILGSVLGSVLSGAGSGSDGSWGGGGRMGGYGGGRSGGGGATSSW